MDNFWKDKEAGIDYQGFLRIFSKYQVQMDRETKVSAIQKVISDDTIRKKKDLYMKIRQALNQTGRSLGEIFRKIDSDHSNSISSEELY